MPRRLADGIKLWWDGEYIPPPPNDPHSGLWIITMGRYKRHWTSRLAHVLVTFYLRYWQWLWTAAIAIVLALVKL